MEHFESTQGSGLPGQPGEPARLPGHPRGHGGGGGGLGSALHGGAGGSGGFDGGKPGNAGKAPGAGYGPGGGKGGTAANNPPGAGGGSHATIGIAGSTALKGTPYGSKLLLPLLGGSGDGRIRIDLVQRDGLALNFNPGSAGTLVVGTLLTVPPPVSSCLEVVNVAGHPVQPGLQSSVFISLPPGSTGNQGVVVEVRDFNQVLAITGKWVDSINARWGEADRSRRRG